MSCRRHPTTNEQLKESVGQWTGEYTENPRGTFREKMCLRVSTGMEVGGSQGNGCRGDLLGSRGFGGGYMITLRHTKKEMMEMALVFLGRRF